MKNKKYVVISTVRASLGTMMSGGFISQPCNYRTGDLGLIHPSIVSFWENFHRNYFRKGKGIACCSTYVTGSPGIYTHKKDNIPVLVYNGHLLYCGSPPPSSIKKKISHNPIK